MSSVIYIYDNYWCGSHSPYLFEHVIKGRFWNKLEFGYEKDPNDSGLGIPHK